MSEVAEFEVPARVEYVGLLRMLVSSLAADHRDLDDDRLDDLRLAVSEACNVILSAGPDQRLNVRCHDDTSALVVDVSAGVTPPLGDSIPLQLMRELVDEVTTVGDGDGEALRLRMLCGHPSA